MLEDSALQMPRIGKETLVPALVCACFSIFLMQTGLFGFFFLVPLGLCALVFGPLAAWVCSVFAILGNGLLSLGFPMREGMGFAGAGLDILCFAVFNLSFVWLMAGNPAMLNLPPGRTAFRFVAASAAVALMFLIKIFYSLYGNEDFSALIRSQIVDIASPYINSSGLDADGKAYLEQVLDPDNVLQMLFAIVLRGGAMVSAFFLLFFSRQTALILARLFRRQVQGAAADLTGFHAPGRAIWVFALCFPVILLCRFISVEIVEIAAWNVLVACAIMFLAQGCGIVLSFLARRPMSLIMRLVCCLAFVLVILSPGINVAALGLLVILGIAENWLPMRAGLFKN